MATWTWNSVAASSSYGVRCFASDNTGQYIIAGTSTGLIYSINSGVSWTISASISSTVTAVASSANGAIMYAAIDALIYKSIDYGVSWAGIASPVGNRFSGICCDSNGQNIVICSNKALGGSGYLQYSLVGDSWESAKPSSTLEDPNPQPYSQNFTSVACMPTGPTRYYVALASDNSGTNPYESGIYKTTTPASVWTRETQSGTTGQTWTSVACNQDASKFIVSSSGNGTSTGTGIVMTNSNLSTPGQWSIVATASKPYVGVAISKTGDQYYACAGSDGLYYGPFNGLSLDTNSTSKGNVTAVYLYPGGSRVGFPNFLGLFGSGISFGLYSADYTVICFKEGTKILCLVDGVETYIPIETMTTNTLVKTSLDGYKKVELLGFSKLYNPSNTLKSLNRLYKCTPAKYPELTEDLIITGHHAILENTITEKQRADLIDAMGNIYVTDRKYRLLACVDDRAEPYTEEGVHTIWHFALENPEQTWNYGVYAHGLLVESCSIRTMRDLSGMTLL